MQIILTMALYNYKVLVIIQKNFTFCAGKSQENFKNIFPGLSRTNKQNSRTFQDSKKNPGLSRTFPGCGNPVICYVSHLSISYAMYVIQPGTKVSVEVETEL